jgi:acyl carrier protein
MDMPPPPDSTLLLIRDFLATHSAGAGGQEVTPETPLIDGGLLDSLGTLQLMEFLSEQLGIVVEDDDFVAENFETVASLAAFIRRKQTDRPLSG